MTAYIRAEKLKIYAMKDLKSFFLCIAILLTGIHAQAQKARVTDENLGFSYLQLPASSNTSDLNTYTAVIIADKSIKQLGVNTASYNDNLTLHGKNKIPSGGHYLLEVRIGAPTFSGRTVDKQTKTTESKDGKKTTTTTYKPRCIYKSAPITYKLVDYKNNLLIDESIANSQGTMTTKAQRSQESANAELNKEIRNRVSERIFDAINSISNHVSYQYGYQVIPVSTKLYRLKTDKHPEFTKYDKAFTGASKILTSLQPGTDAASITESLKPHVEYWEKLAAGISNDDKKASKLKFASLYNAAVLNMWSQQMDAVKNNFAKLEALSKKDYQVDLLKKMSDRITSQLNKYPEEGLYFSYELGEARPPETVEYDFEAVMADVQSTESIPRTGEQEVLRGKLFQKGEEVDAAFVLPINDISGGARSLEPSKGFKIYTYNGTDYVMLPSLKTSLRPGDYFLVDDMKYEILDADGKYWDIKEIYYESEKIQCYGLNSMNKRPIFPKLLLKKTSASAAWQRGLMSEEKAMASLQAYFNDCPDLVDHVFGEETDRDTKTIFRSVGEYYTNSCK